MISVIIVEDENKIREGFIRIIDWELYGFQVIGSASNGIEGIELIENLNPNLVFVDVNMPIMSGLEMLESLRDNQSFCAIVVSGYDDFEYAQNAIKLNVFDYLLKPVLKEELISVLERYKKERKNKQYSVEIKEKLDEVLVLPSTLGDISVLRAMQYIDSNLNEVITADDMAFELNISVSKLNSIFIIDTGYTFHKFLTRYRIRKAMELLITTNLFIYEVGNLVGFPDYKYFGSIFKKYTKTSVSEFKEQITYLNKKGAI